MTISLDKTTLTTITRPNFTFSQETITASTDTSEGDEDFEEINSVTAVINQTEDNVTITGGDTSVAIVGLTQILSLIPSLMLMVTLVINL